MTTSISPASPIDFRNLIGRHIAIYPDEYEKWKKDMEERILEEKKQQEKMSIDDSFKKDG